MVNRGDKNITISKADMQDQVPHVITEHLWVQRDARGGSQIADGEDRRTDGGGTAEFAAHFFADIRHAAHVQPPLLNVTEMIHAARLLFARPSSVRPRLLSSSSSLCCYFRLPPEQHFSVS